MASVLTNHILATLRKLNGRAHVTYPFGSTTGRRIERLLKVAHADKEALFAGNTDEQYTSATLIAQEIIGGDDIYLEVYRAWQELPGASLGGAEKSKPRRTPSKYITSESVATTRQAVATGTSPSNPSNEGDASVVEPENAIVAQKTDRALTLTTAGATEYRKNGDDQLVTVAGSVGSDGTAPTLSATTEVAEVSALGDGKFERVLGTVPAVFDRRAESKGDGIDFPTRFLASPYRETVATTQAGTSTTPDALAANGIGIISSQVARDGAFKTRKTNVTVSGSNTALAGYEFDEATGLLLPITEQAVAAGTSGVALQTDGTYAEVKPFNTAWSIKTTRQATALDSTGRTYSIKEHVSLPRVLTVFTPVVFTDSGGDIRFADFQTELKDYSGGYDITVVERWKSTPWTGLAITNFRPTGFHWITPYSRGSVPECLHGSITISGTTGTSDPVWGYLTWSYSYAATSPTGISGTITLKDTQQPWRGGYLRRTETISV